MANHNPELRFEICTVVALFGLVLHFNCADLSQSKSSNFSMYIIIIVIVIIVIRSIIYLKVVTQGDISPKARSTG